MKQTNERLCALAQKGDATALDGLIENNKSFIGKVANDLFRSMNLAQSGLNLDTVVVYLKIKAPSSITIQETEEGAKGKERSKWFRANRLF